MIIGDLPYNMTTEGWDHQITKAQLHTILAQAAASNTSDKFTVFFFHKPLDINIVHEVFTERHLACIQNVYWVKPRQYSSLPDYFYTSAVEMATVGCYPNSKDLSKGLPKDPRERANVYSVPSLTTLYQKSDGTPINPCQKPKELASKIISNHAGPGDWILVIGFGGGAEVEGALDVGCNVVAVDFDEVQWKAFSGHIIQEEEKFLKAQAAAKKAAKKKSERESSPSTPVSVVSTSSAVSTSTLADVSGANVCGECGLEVSYDSDQSPLNCSSCDKGTNLHPNCAMKTDDDQIICITCNDKLSPLDE